MPVRRQIVTDLTTDASGDATGYTGYFSGRITGVVYAKAGSGNYADGVDFTLTSENTGETIWAENNVNATASRYPRVGTQSTAAAASLYAGGGTAVNDYIRLSRDRVKIVVAQGGNGGKGTFHIIAQD